MRIIIIFIANISYLSIIENGSQIMKYNTKNRKLVLDFLKNNSDKHLTIEEIYNALNEEVPLASLYRIIDDLSESGEIRKYIISINEPSRYQYIDNKDEHLHFHLLCTKCGKLIHLECHEVNNLIKHIEDNHKFAIDVSKVNLYGLCEDCQKEENK